MELLIGFIGWGLIISIPSAIVALFAARKGYGFGGWFVLAFPMIFLIPQLFLGFLIVCAFLPFSCRSCGAKLSTDRDSRLAHKCAPKSMKRVGFMYGFKEWFRYGAARSAIKHFLMPMDGPLVANVDKEKLSEFLLQRAWQKNREMFDGSGHIDGAQMQKPGPFVIAAAAFDEGMKSSNDKVRMMSTIALASLIKHISETKVVFINTEVEILKRILFSESGLGLPGIEYTEDVLRKILPPDLVPTF